MKVRALCVALAAGAAAPVASGQVIDWTNGGGGDWNNAANWNPMNVPNAPGEIARFNIGGAYAVSYPLGVQIGGLEVLDAGATINVLTGTTLAVAATSATNNGVVVVNSNVGNSGTLFRVDGNLVLSGSGRITLTATGNLETARLDTNSTTLTNNAGHTINGTGNIRAAIINNGLIRADAPGAALQLLTVNQTNHAVVRAVSGGILQVNGIGVDQTGGGQIIADNGTVNYINGSLTGGTISAINGGGVSISGLPTFIGTTFSAGTMSIPTGQSLLVAGTGLTNNGIIVVNSNTGNSATQVRYDATAALAGTGDIVLQATGNLETANFNTNGTTVTQAAQHDIRGTGNIRAALVNNGRVIADQNGKVLQLLTVSQTNNRTLRAQSGGILQIYGITVTQGVNGRIDTLSGGLLSFINGAIVGGVIDSSGGSATIGGSPTFNDVADVMGPVNIPTGNSLLVRGAGLIHSGVVTINSNVGNSATQVRFDEDGALGGPGVVELSATGNLETANLNTNATTITHAATHTIKGTGNIRSAMVNNGRILADRAGGAVLQLLTVNQTNNFDLRATGGGVLQVSGITVTQGVNGVVTADPGSTVNLVNCSIVSGHTDSRGVTNILGTTTFTDVHHLGGPINIPTANAMIVRGAGLENDGTITINSNVGSAGTVLRFDESGTLSGAGSVVLSANGNLDTAQFNTNSTQITQAASHTIRGTGRLRSSLINEGLVAADQAGAALEILGPAQTNRAEVRADNGGTLQVTGTTITQDPGARLIADNGGVLSMLSATITGGLLDSTGGSGVISGNTTFNSLSTDGAWGLPTGNSLLVNGTIRNDGEITINSNTGGAGTQVRFDSAGGFTGSGRLVLNHNGNPDTAQFNRGGAFVPENGPNHTIAGNGRIRTPLLNRGTIAPGLSAGVLEFISAALDFEPSATYECEVGGVAPAAYDRILMNGVGANALLDGTLNVTVSGFTPALCDSFTIIDGVGGGAVSGEFAAVNITVNPPLPADRKFRVIYTANDVLLRLTCFPDFNSDCTLDIFDFLEFQNQFAAGSPEACNCDRGTGPNVCDIFDFLCFQNAFVTGCP